MMAFILRTLTGDEAKGHGGLGRPLERITGNTMSVSRQLSYAEPVSVMPMNWTGYAAYLMFAVVVVLIPGPDFAVVVGNTISGGRRRGMWCAAGVASSNAVQGTAAILGLGALVLRAQPVFHIVKWMGAAYLLYLGLRLLGAAWRGRYEVPDATGNQDTRRGWRQGFFSNITNPKVLVFYVAVLPQFLTPGAGPMALALFALSHAALSLLYLLTLTAVMHRARRVLARRRVRRCLDGTTGVAMMGFGVRLAFEQQ
jgi:threonine/homoserine/homoserine lactone efflux protein